MTYEALLALMRSRRSVRRFADRPVEREAVERVVEAARWAPSNHNRQGWRFLVWRDRERIQGLAVAVRAELAEGLPAMRAVLGSQAEREVEHASWFGAAPCLVLVLHKRPAAVAAAVLGDAPHRDLVSGEPLSAAMAVQNLLLAARALGLGACVMTGPLMARKAFAALAEVPPGHEPLALVALGHPADEPTTPRRKRLDHILEFLDNPEI